MADLAQDLVLGQLLAILQEGFEGSPHRWSYFTDSGPEGGLFATLAQLTAAEASRVVGGNSIAAQVHHVVFGLDASAAWIRGERTPRDWKESWRVSTVDDAAWAKLQQRLRTEYGTLRTEMTAHALDSVEAYGGALAAITHVAYHLGAIRQKVAAQRSAVR